LAAIALVLLIALLAWFGPHWFRRWRHKAHLMEIIRSGGTRSDASELYERMLEVLARRGFQKPPWFTPGEFVSNLPAEEHARVAEFTAVYNAVRFGGEAAGTARLAVMLQELER
jgi:hypothetical protein